MDGRMRLAKLTLQRAIGIVIGLLAVFLLINYSLELGFLSRRGAKGWLLLTIGLGIVWWGFFAPTRQELREDHDRKKGERDS
jgi:hypothetical protein